MWAVCALWWLGLAPWARATLGGCQSLLRPPGGYGRSFFGRMPVLAKVTAGCGRAGAALKGYLLEWVGWVGQSAVEAVLARLRESDRISICQCQAS